MKNLTRDEALILGLLSQLRGTVVRTKLVKLVYLLDNMAFEQRKQQLTSFRYHWDHYGPNALGNKIVELLAQLSKRGLIRESQALTPYENYANYYRIDDSIDLSKLPLSGDDWALVVAVAKIYGTQPRSVVVSKSKETAPVKNAKQYDVLEFVLNERVEALKAKFLTNRDFVKRTEGSLGYSGPGITLEQLRVKIRERTAV